MVASRAGRGRSYPRLDYGGIDRLLGSRLHLAAPRGHRAGSVELGATRNCDPSPAAALPLEEALRDLDLVAWLKVDVLRRIAAKLADVVNCDLAPTQKPDALLVREIVESTGCVDGSEQRHVFRERNARRSAHGAPHVYKAEAR